MVIIKQILNSFLFWGGWIIIPFIMEIVPALGSVFLLIRRNLRHKKKRKEMKIYPEISLIIPVYNSADTLYGCIKSVNDSTYPNDKIRIFLVNNKGQDNSFAVYADCQKKFPDLLMQWLNAEQGKSRALNLALYNSDGKYIINLDSDGILEKNALVNLITRFEQDTDLNCMTGAILTIPEQIQAYKGFFPRLLRNLEFMEYAQAFLAGRSYASEMNAVYTLSGAFSAFRKSVVLKSWMYNTDTICEDTHITFQMKYRQNERVEVCEDAIFFVDPIEDMNKLYTQRQRWQRGSLEVAKMFMDKSFKVKNIFSNVSVKTLLYDHTFAFPRMIWYQEKKQKNKEGDKCIDDMYVADSSQETAGQYAAGRQNETSGAGNSQDTAVQVESLEAEKAVADKKMVADEALEKTDEKASRSSSKERLEEIHKKADIKQHIESRSNNQHNEDDKHNRQSVSQPHKKKDLIGRLKAALNSVKDKLISIKSKFKKLLKAIVDKKRSAWQKINDLKVIINDEENKELVRLIKKELKELIREITPVKYDVNVRYGCEEPYMTGRILGVIAVIYGITGVQFNITPEFEQKVLEGDIYMKGRVRIYRLLLIALRIYKNNRFRKLVFNKG